MFMNAYSGGSAITVKSIAPSVHLSRLVDLLAKSLKDITSSGAFIHCSKDKIIINIEDVLHSLYNNPEFKSEFSSDPDKGFVRDIEMPPKGTQARVGGRLFTGSEKALANAVNRLVEIIEEHIDRQVPADMFSKLTEYSVAETIRKIAKNFGVQEPQLPTVAKLVPVAFSSREQNPVAFQNIQKPQDDIARMFSAIEESKAGDINRFIEGISNVLKQRDYDETDIDVITQSLQMRAQRPGDTINTFLQFLEDEAHSRVRMQVAMSLMKAIANQHAIPEFKTYVERVLECFNRFAGINGEAHPFDVSIDFPNSNFDFSAFLRQASFYDCLPVWAEWSVQMFENRTNSTSGHSVITREVNYRFRVNGTNTEARQYAFDARIERHKNKIFGKKEHASFLARPIAELVFLWLVVPNDCNDTAEFDVVAKTIEIAEKLKHAPKTTLTTIINDLENRSDVMVRIATNLVGIIKNRSEAVLKEAKETTNSLRLFVLQSILNREAFASYTDERDILVRAPEHRSSEQRNRMEWLKHLTVEKDLLLPEKDLILSHSLFSFEVTTKLQESSLMAVDSPRDLAMTSVLSERALPIRLAPFKKANKTSKGQEVSAQTFPVWRPPFKKTPFQKALFQKATEDSTHVWKPAEGSEGSLDPGFGIEIRYDCTDCTEEYKDLKNSEKADMEHRKAAEISAFAVLSYVTLWLLMRRIRAVHSGFSTMLLRVATEGRAKTYEEDKYNKSTIMYAISKSLERALAREGNVKLQGYVTNGDSQTEEFRKITAATALTSGQALSFQLEGSLDRVALVSYVTRPCDTHPLSREPDLYLFACRTYVAERQESGAQIRMARMRHQIIGSRENFGEGQPVLTELHWLASQGYKHVMLLSHHFGNRHLGRAAERHAPHSSREFLNKAHQEFPEMRLYALRRDVFFATRLRKRETNESAFEVLTFADHAILYRQNPMRSIIPIYTFATLHVVGNDNGRPQSGFCTYFFDYDPALANPVWQEEIRSDILGSGGNDRVRASLISMLRAVHFLESEKPSSRIFLPVLDPYDWVAPVQRAHAGEIVIMDRRDKGTVILSLPALVSHITSVLKDRFQEKGAA